MAQTFDELIGAARAAHDAEVAALQARIDELEAGEPPAPVETVTVWKQVNFREAPNLKSSTKIYRQLDVGETVTLLATVTGDVWGGISEWYEIKDKSGQTGYAHSYFFVDSPPTAAKPCVSPVGSDGIWGAWTKSTGYGDWYEIRDGVWNYHTGVDLNLNKPSWNLDAGMPVYAVTDGTVLRAYDSRRAFGKLVTIDHGDFITRSAHLLDIDVEAGQQVTQGQIIGHIGTTGTTSPHLHFDMSHSGILRTQPEHWPGANLDEVHRHYFNPELYLRANYTAEEPPYDAIAPVSAGWIGFDGPGDTGSPTNPLEMEGWPYLVPEHQVMSKIGGARVQAMRLHFPGTPAAVIEQIKALPTIQFLCGRVRYDFPAGYDTAPEMHLEAVAPFIQRGLDAGIWWWSFINEPNIPASIAPEGLGGAWYSATGCGTWLVEWAWRARKRWPGIKLLLPAVSPGIEGHEGWWQKMADYALDEMDGVGIHSYWTDAASLASEIERVVAFARSMEHKPVFVTECANVAGASPQDKAVQLVKFWQEVTSRTSNIEFVGWFNVFTTHPDHKVSEVDLAMAEALGQLLEEM